ncbi:hypothetical protein EVAR_7936_1 [Eumeta japonica]|uniref:Uncharacterized protein n=1 Tax=Eumeta variegata TaxID=151549 RepID=A0A4C1TV75_EUMVA|nr:hypothetical protein EVAR_7936_1 [Eumeta japonica]
MRRLNARLPMTDCRRRNPPAFIGDVKPHVGHGHIKFSLPGRFVTSQYKKYPLTVLYAKRESLNYLSLLSESSMKGLTGLRAISFEGGWDKKTSQSNLGHMATRRVAVQ